MNFVEPKTTTITIKNGDKVQLETAIALFSIMNRGGIMRHKSVKTEPTGPPPEPIKTIKNEEKPKATIIPPVERSAEDKKCFRKSRNKLLN